MPGKSVRRRVAARGHSVSLRWVVKAGSSMVCSGGPLLVRAWMRQLAGLRSERGIEVVWVTSGAIASAVERARFRGARVGARRTLAEKQALSAIGQPLVMDLYNLSLQVTGHLGSQVLLTYDDLADAERRANFRRTIEQLLKWGVTPILNENDAVATEEIRFGDNDSLSAKVAREVGASRLVILSDVDGLYDSDPRRNPSARLIHGLDGVKPATLRLAGLRASNERGTGGMYSKLLAAREAGRAGIETWLVRGDKPDILGRVARDETVGTRIAARPR